MKRDGCNKLLKRLLKKPFGNLQCNYIYCIWIDNKISIVLYCIVLYCIVVLYSLYCISGMAYKQNEKKRSETDHGSVDRNALII